jgi:hypothetical protein
MLLSRPEKGNINVIEDKVLEKERSRAFELSKSDRFKYRTRYFTDSGIIGSKQFVSANYQRFKITRPNFLTFVFVSPTAIYTHLTLSLHFKQEFRPCNLYQFQIWYLKYFHINA